MEGLQLSTVPRPVVSSSSVAAASTGVTPAAAQRFLAPPRSDLAGSSAATPTLVGTAAAAAVGVAAGLAAARRRERGAANSTRRSEKHIVARKLGVYDGEIEAKTSGYFPRKPTPLLDSLRNQGPQRTRSMNIQQLEELAEEVRWQVLDAVSVSGGHLGAGLGVTDLTVALHHVFDTPRDEIIWDVAHQCQPHKVLTGRRDRIYTLRQGGGLAGFAKRSESEYDAFGAGHSSTSISAAVGFAEARKKLGKTGHSIAVIGDGAITGGMAWEAMNHAGGLGSKLIVILNDNGQVSLPTFYNQVNTPVGALSETLAGQEAQGLNIQGNIAKIETSDAFQQGRQFLKTASKSLLPSQLSSAAAKLDEYTRDFVKTVPFKGSGSGGKGELFEQLGFYYVGPIDGHKMETLVEVLNNLKGQHESGQLQKPVLLHIKTRKGKGYEDAEEASDKFHAVAPKFNMPKKASPVPSEPAPKKAEPLTKVFADQLVKEGERDPKIVAVTAAMPGGTGVSIFEKRFGPSRTFDVGIAEQHAVTMSASMAAGGLKPFCCIYSTFLQRGYDQLVHDVALQNLPVRFIIDRAGLVGSDGPTHGGTFDLSFMGCVPNMMICASSDQAELANMVHTIAMIDDAPTALRYPRGAGYDHIELPSTPRFLEPGKGRIAREGRDNSLAILSLGGRLQECLKAAEELEERGVSVTVADARWMKPLDKKLINFLAEEHRAMITIEENAIGGFGSQVQQVLFEAGHFDAVGRSPLAFRSMAFPDTWIQHDDPALQYAEAKLNAEHIVEKASLLLTRIGKKVATVA
eukprot:TRINITY_DN6272_c0_g1_i2.p1 TRINITY_DN6272_c0_g1~~TRINITY_DN6272_c0_g1_i2.p1  ORF type:complete len:800 (-),score=232.99 TRINITY_DN6272_c0_g1_i2:430-2829(-)